NGIRQLKEMDPKLVSFRLNDISSVITMVMLTSLGSWGLPQMVHKFYTIKDEKAIKTGMIISTVFALLIASSAYFLGAFGRFFMDAPAAAGAAVDTSTIVPVMITRALPEILIGLVVALVLSASMSTLSSLVLVSASSIAVDLLKGHFKKDMSEKSVVMVLRILCVVFVGVSLLIALDKNNAIVTLMSYSWGTISGCFIAPFTYGLYWKGMTKAGAFSGIICGLAVNLLGFFFIKNAALAGVISMLASLVIVPIVSLCTKKYSDEFNKDIMDF
ncbi:MAG: sodium:solute symporter, partial [Clostridia bacterium]|nr:sodium:solute symporter [Clostridia bacterium]